MSVTTVDRRRTPRAVIVDTPMSVLACRVPVRLLDISVSGVMLESAHPVEIGTGGTLRFDFAGEPFSAEVQVERLSAIAPSSKSERSSIGAAFVALSEQDQRVIERFSDQ